MPLGSARPGGAAHCGRKGDRLAISRAGWVVRGQSRRGETLDQRRCLGHGRFHFLVAHVVGRHTVEAVAVAECTRVGGRCLRSGRLPKGGLAAVVGYENIVRCNARACAAIRVQVLAAPVDGEARLRFRGRKRADTAGGRANVNGVEGLRSFHRRVDIENNAGLAGDLRTRGQAGLRVNGIAHQARPVKVGIVGRQKTSRRVGHFLTRDRVNGCHGPGNDARVGIESGGDIDRVGIGGYIDLRGVILQAGRHLDFDVVEIDVLKLEGAPVEVGRELVGDDDLHCRGWGRGHVLERYRVGNCLTGGNPTLRPKTAGDHVVGIAGLDHLFLNGCRLAPER